MSAPKSDESAIRLTIRALKAAGYKLDHVADPDYVKVTTEGEALDAITAVDDADLYVKSDNGSTHWIRFVMGNEPFEVICDHGVSLSHVLDPLTQSWSA